MKTKLFELVTGTSTKQELAGNMLPNINVCEMDGRISHKIIILALKLLELTRFASQNQSFTLILQGVGGPL